MSSLSDITQNSAAGRIWDGASSAGAVRRRRFFNPAPMFPPPVADVSRADLTAAYDAACERAARDGCPTDFAEAQMLGAALD